jgi:HK97 gp10 family phage protein
MKAQYNLVGKARKELAHAVARILGMEATYMGMPTAAYRIGQFELDKEGTLTWPDNANIMTVERVLVVMAKMEIVLDEAFMAKLEGLEGKADEIIEKALRAGAAVVYSAVSSRLASSIGNTKFKSRSTGTLQSSLGVSPVKVGRDGSVDIKVGFADPRRGGGNNALIAGVLEHGKVGQPGKPFIKPAMSASKAAAEAAMAAVIDQELGAL